MDTTTRTHILSTATDPLDLQALAFVNGITTGTCTRTVVEDPHNTCGNPQCINWDHWTETTTTEIGA